MEFQRTEPPAIITNRSTPAVLRWVVPRADEQEAPFAVPSKAEPLTDAELAAGEAKRDLASELLQSVREMKAAKAQVVLTLAGK
jgi:hypothetical protein